MKKNLVRIVSICVAMSFFVGCAAATHPDKISATYVSPLEYQAYSCSQIRQELVRVNRKLLEVTGQQDKKADKDASLQIDALFFLPALFFMIGGDKKEELAKLKGEYEALESMALKKECNISAELEEVKQQRKKYKEERKQSLSEENDKSGR